MNGSQQVLGRWPRLWAISGRLGAAARERAQAHFSAATMTDAYEESFGITA